MHTYPNKIASGIGLMRKNNSKFYLKPTSGWHTNLHYRQRSRKLDYDLFVIGSESQLALNNTKMHTF